MSDKSLLDYLPGGVQDQITIKQTSYWVSLLSGAMIPLSFAPFNTLNSLFSYLIFFPLALFFFQLLNTHSVKEAFFKGWLFGLGLFGVGVSWLYIAIHDFGSAHWLLAGFLTALFISAMALYYAVFAWFIYKLRINIGLKTENPYKTDEGGSVEPKIFIVQKRLILFYLPLLWVFFEWLRSWLLTGFPWILVGYPLIETPLSAYAPVFGIYGLSLLVVFIASLFIVRIKLIYSVAIIVILMISGTLIGKIHWGEDQGKVLKVALIQGNIAQSVKWDRQQLEKTKEIYTGLSQQQWLSNDIIIWPENAIPVFYHSLESSFYHDLKLQAEKTQTELVTGLPVFDDSSQQYYNAMTNFGGEQGFYYKTHLVPFGEYVPLTSLLRGLIRFFDMPMSGFSAGKAQQDLPSIKGNKVLVTLCYEDVYAQDVMQQIPQAQWMLNLSNNGWYGNSLAPHQHLEMARMRALESSRELVRSTTSGISAIIDYKGGIRVKGPQFKSAVINGTIQPRTGTTPYVSWGNYPIFFLFIIASIFFFLKDNQDD
ncbi:MAG: apolipoprotein N-acyltransferase [gamma proteobacterium symbiont of Taylorina sp.]|nr:apolipoprotein N-acyltransferase [gamma proteobacterium symbiont of Taylorina sp.]